MPIAEQTASSQVSENGLWLGTRSGWADEIWRLLHYYTQPAHLFFQDVHAQQVHKLSFLCWRSKTLNFSFGICKTKGGLLISNDPPCYDDLSDSVITSPLRLALTTWLDTSRGPNIHKHLALKKSIKVISRSRKENLCIQKTNMQKTKENAFTQNTNYDSWVNLDLGVPPIVNLILLGGL